MQKLCNIESVLLATNEEILAECASSLVDIYGRLRVRVSHSSIGTMYVYAIGNIPICLVAHADTMREENSKIKLTHTRGNIIRNEFGVLGADDRAGVYAIWRVLEHGYRPSVLITNFEECGALGSISFAESSPTVWSGRDNLFIGVDRRGANEYVTYNGRLAVEVSSYVESFGFVLCCGTMSDVMFISDRLRVPSVNISVGYHNEHTDYESLHLDELEMSVNRLVKMCQDPIDQRYPLDTGDDTYIDLWDYDDRGYYVDKFKWEIFH